MPIKSISLAEDKLVQQCAACDKLNELVISSLQLGCGTAPRFNKDGIACPACSCGAVEFLIRTWDSVPPDGAVGDPNIRRKVVNGLAQHLRGQGKVLADVATEVAAETETPPDVMELPATGTLDVPVPISFKGSRLPTP